MPFLIYIRFVKLNTISCLLTWLPVSLQSHWRCHWTFGEASPVVKIWKTIPFSVQYRASLTPFSVNKSFLISKDNLIIRIVLYRSSKYWISTSSFSLCYLFWRTQLIVYGSKHGRGEIFIYSTFGKILAFTNTQQLLVFTIYLEIVGHCLDICNSTFGWLWWIQTGFIGNLVCHTFR